MSKSNIIYVLNGKQRAEEVVLGFIQYEMYNTTNMSDTVRNFLDTKDVLFWKECDNFIKLDNFPSLMYTTVTRRANLIYCTFLACHELTFWHHRIFHLGKSW
jgi:hypothetical protein